MNLNGKDENVFLEKIEYTKYFKVENELDSIIKKKYNEEKYIFKLNITSITDEKTVIEVLNMKEIEFAILDNEIIINISNEALSREEITINYLELEKTNYVGLCKDVLSIIFLIIIMFMFKDVSMMSNSNLFYNILSKLIFIAIAAISLIDIKSLIRNIFIDKRISGLINTK